MIVSLKCVLESSFRPFPIPTLAWGASSYASHFSCFYFGDEKLLRATKNVFQRKREVFPVMAAFRDLSESDVVFLSLLGGGGEESRENLSSLFCSQNKSSRLFGRLSGALSWISVALFRLKAANCLPWTALSDVNWTLHHIEFIHSPDFIQRLHELTHTIAPSAYISWKEFSCKINK